MVKDWARVPARGLVPAELAVKPAAPREESWKGAYEIKVTLKFPGRIHLALNDTQRVVVLNGLGGTA